MIVLKNHLKTHYIIYIFTLVFIIYAFLTYKTIPIGNGEEYRLLRGQETLDHLLNGQFKEKLLQPIPNYFLYNLYPMILVALNPNFYYEWFHLMNLLFSSLAFVATYFLTFRTTNSTKAGIFSVLALVLFPRFFGQLGFNPIDMPFAVFYLWSLLAILQFSKKSVNHWSILVLGILFGITQGLRQLGFTIYFLLVLSDLWEFLKSSQHSQAITRQKSALKVIKQFIAQHYLKYIYIFIIANFFMLITWPNFAINFYKSYVWYLFVGSNFYLWDFGLLFFGEFLQNSQRPWYYLPFFQLIMYPVYISALFLLGLRYFPRLLKNKTYFLLFSALVINYILYFVLNPVLYDGLRHFLFFIPIFVVIAVTHLHQILQVWVKTPAKKFVTIILVFIGMLPSLVFTIKEYPYHYAYFNKIAYVFGNPYELFESDYANTSYRKASEWIRNEYLKDESVYSHINPKKMLRVYACDNAYAVDYYSHKKFITEINREKADLTICDYRNLKQSGYTGEIIKSFSLGGSDILFILIN